jgi:hypothetical protein
LIAGAAAAGGFGVSGAGVVAALAAESAAGLSDLLQAAIVMMEMRLTWAEMRLLNMVCAPGWWTAMCVPRLQKRHI